MQKTDTTPSPAPNPASPNWSFAEVWIDPMLSPPYVLLLLNAPSGNCSIYDPAEGYQIIYTSASYDEAQNWLLEDEYEPITGRFSSTEL